MNDYSDIDLVYLWLDFGDHWLKTATTEMIMSAQRAMPGINIIQISDKAARKHPLANSAMVFDKIVDQGEVAAFRGYAIAQHMLATERRAIVCDVDMIWNNDGAAKFAQGTDIPVACGFDDSAMADTSLIVARPGCSKFWGPYQRMCDALKGEPRAYGGDRFAFYAMIGQPYRHEFRLAGASVAPAEQPTAPMDCWATHFAAHRDWLVPYARMLDGGAPFEALMPGLDEVVHDHA